MPLMGRMLTIIRNVRRCPPFDPGRISVSYLVGKAGSDGPKVNAGPSRDKKFAPLPSLCPPAPLEGCATTTQHLPLEMASPSPYHSLGGQEKAKSPL